MALAGAVSSADKAVTQNEVYCDVWIDVGLDTKAVWEAVTIVMDKHKVFQSLLFLNIILCVIICSLSILEASQLLSFLLNALEGRSTCDVRSSNRVAFFFHPWIIPSLIIEIVEMGMPWIQSISSDSEEDCWLKLSEGILS